MTATEKKSPLRVQCDKCAHIWTALYTPMEIGAVAKILRRVMCPMCGAGTKDIHMLERKP